MNRNVESHFSRLPQVDIQRSIFDRSHSHITSMNAGELIPLFIDDILPGDTVNMTLSSVVRAQTLLSPLFSDCYLDTYAFFVPSRLVWSHWRDFCGENNESAWVPTTQYRVPTISSPEGGFASGTLADYFGLPVGVEWDNDAVNAPIALPFRAYGLIVDQWFRDQNLQDPINVPLGDANQTGTNSTSEGSTYIDDICNGGKPFIAAKYHDYFTSALPNAQKGSPVTLPIGQFDLAVHTGDPYSIAGDSPVRWTTLDGLTNQGLSLFSDRDPETGVLPYTSKVVTTSGSVPSSATITYGASPLFVPYNVPVAASKGSVDAMNPDNLHAVGNAGSVTVNDLRFAFQYQRFLEKLSRQGSRYPELLAGLFGVTSPDASLQRPEYLGGMHLPLNVQQVSNTAQTNTDYLGDVGAMSVTSDVSNIVEKSFTEYGFLIVLGVVRYDHSYPQGMDALWNRKDFLQYYQPVFANIGEQPIQTCEICATAENMASSDAFGFQEAWAAYRYKQNRCSGEMRPGIPNSLASWHLGDYYTSAPVLSSEWIMEDKSNVDRTLAVTSQVANQFFGDFFFKCTYTRPMPLYSVPGLIDHN